MTEYVEYLRYRAAKGENVYDPRELLEEFPRTALTKAVLKGQSLDEAWDAFALWRSLLPAGEMKNALGKDAFVDAALVFELAMFLMSSAINPLTVDSVPLSMRFRAITKSKRKAQLLRLQKHIGLTIDGLFVLSNEFGLSGDLFNRAVRELKRLQKNYSEQVRLTGSGLASLPRHDQFLEERVPKIEDAAANSFAFRSREVLSKGLGIPLRKANEIVLHLLKVYDSSLNAVSLNQRCKRVASKEGDSFTKTYRKIASKLERIIELKSPGRIARIK